MSRALRLLAIASIAIATPAAVAAPVIVTEQTAAKKAYDDFSNQVLIPVEDPELEAKFAKENPDVIRVIQAANKMVNNYIISVGDDTQYGLKDYWAMLPPSRKGDCEDYAIAKYAALQIMGFPVVEQSKLVFVVVHDGGMRFGHAILAIQLPNGSVAYLDNLNEKMMTEAELVGQGYEFFHWA